MTRSSGIPTGIRLVRGGFDGLFDRLLHRDRRFQGAGHAAEEDLDDVGCLALGEVLDLLATGDARNGDDGILRTARPYPGNERLDQSPAASWVASTGSFAAADLWGRWSGMCPSSQGEPRIT